MKKDSVKSKAIRKGLKVIAISGNCRGQVGNVQAVKGDKVIVQGLNMRKKHMKPTQGNPKGAIVNFEGPIHISNVKVWEDRPAVAGQE